MICQECKEQGLKSKVYEKSNIQPLVYVIPFYDEEGRYHNHNHNVPAITYECTNGHSWVKKHITPCWCGWPFECSEVEKEVKNES